MCNFQINIIQRGAGMTRPIFYKILTKRQSIARPLGQGVACLLYIQSLTYILPQSLKWCMRYHGLLECVIMALGCICRWAINCLSVYITSVGFSSLHMCWFPNISYIFMLYITALLSRKDRYQYIYIYFIHSNSDVLRESACQNIPLIISQEENLSAERLHI